MTPGAEDLNRQFIAYVGPYQKLENSIRLRLNQFIALFLFTKSALILFFFLSLQCKCIKINNAYENQLQ